MSEITRVGADLAKRVIQVHAVDAAGKLVTNRALLRDKFIAWCAQLPKRLHVDDAHSHGQASPFVEIGGVCLFLVKLRRIDRRIT
jgi:hypothetical protein